MSVQLLHVILNAVKNLWNFTMDSSHRYALLRMTEKNRENFAVGVVKNAGALHPHLIISSFCETRLLR